MATPSVESTPIAPDLGGELFRLAPASEVEEDADTLPRIVGHDDDPGLTVHRPDERHVSDPIVWPRSHAVARSKLRALSHENHPLRRGKEAGAFTDELGDDVFTSVEKAPRIPSVTHHLARVLHDLTSIRLSVGAFRGGSPGRA